MRPHAEAEFAQEAYKGVPQYNEIHYSGVMMYSPWVTMYFVNSCRLTFTNNKVLEVSHPCLHTMLQPILFEKQLRGKQFVKKISIPN